MLNEDQIRKIVAETNPKLDWTAQLRDVHFDQLGLDSLDRFDIIVGLQEATGFEVPDDDVAKLHSIASIEAYFADK